MAANNGLLGEMRQRSKDLTHDPTRQKTVRTCARFVDWARETGLKNCDIRADRAAAVQQYVSHLIASGYRTGTVHTYAAQVSHGLGVPLGALDLPKRTVATMRDKYGHGNSRGHDDLAKPQNSRLLDFAKKVGLRRQEYARLLGRDFGRDDSGQLCVLVERGKGGKPQAQVVSPDDRKFVASYFDGRGPTEPVFSRAELKAVHQCNLHALRAAHARAEYARYEQIASTPTGRAELVKQLWARFTNPYIGNKAYLSAVSSGDAKRAAFCRNSFAAEMTAGRYVLRTANRKMAEKHGLPTNFDRLALCAVSVFALSHWRNEVTVKHYMI